MISRLRVPRGSGDRLARSARIERVESLDAEIKHLESRLKVLRAERDFAFFDAKSVGVEVHLLAILTGYTDQAIYQAIDRAKLRVEQRREEEE